MRILVIEDDDAVIDDLRTLGDSDWDLVVAGDRDAGLAAIHSEEVDLILCDLKIPPRPGDLATSDLHGFAVHNEWAEVCPGIPMIIFSGFATLRNTRDKIASSPVADVFFGAPPPFPMLQELDKDELEDCFAVIERWNARVQATLDAVTVASEHVLSKPELLAICAFAQHRGATDATVRPTATRGLSGSATFLVTYGDNQGRAVGRSFLKVGPRKKVLDEIERFQRFVPGVLPMGVYAPYIYHLQYGLGRPAAAFFDIAEAYPRSLFELLASDADFAAARVPAIDSATRPWRTAPTPVRSLLRDLRRSRISDEGFLEMAGDDDAFRRAEETAAELRFCPQHGDLHGENVLFSAAGEPLLIDFGDVGSAPVSADPVILELSLKYNRDSPFRSHSWPSREQAEHWQDLDTYLIDCPCPQFVRACRDWANSVATEVETASMFYAHSARQLKYEPELHAIALSYMRGSAAALVALTTA